MQRNDRSNENGIENNTGCNARNEEEHVDKVLVQVLYAHQVHMAISSSSEESAAERDLTSVVA